MSATTTVAVRRRDLRRVVVTGLGPVSSIGIGCAEFCAGLRAGRCGTSPIRAFDTRGFPRVHGGEVHEFRPRELVRRLDPAAWGRSSLFAAAAARLAVEDAALDLTALDAERIGVVIGTTCGETQPMEEMTARLLAEGPTAPATDAGRKLAAARLAHAASEELGAAGESLTIGAACAAGNYAIAYASDSLAAGEADVMVAGGAESVCRFVHAGFHRLGVLAQRRCTPFDRDREGIITAEGGAALVLETLEHARARGARPYAEVLGHAVNCDAEHMVAAAPERIAACMRLAHRNAGVTAGEVDYVSAHGTGTPGNDAAEWTAIRAVFGTRTPPVSSIKSMLGHAMGAAGAFGAIASALAIHERFLPPTINLSTLDPALAGIDPVANVARAAEPRVVQNDGFGFGGSNAVVMLGATS